MEISPREALILSLRHYSYPPASYKFIAGKLGVSPERVEFLEKKTVSRIRRFGGATYPVSLEELENDQS